MEDFTFDEIHENFLGRSDAKHLNTLQTKLSVEQLNTQLIGPDENIFVLVRRQEPWLQSVSVCIVTIYLLGLSTNFRENFTIIGEDSFARAYSILHVES